MRKLALFAFSLVAMSVWLTAGCGTSPANGAGSLSITTLTLPAAAMGTVYNTTFAVSGGVAPYTFSITSGALPTGISLSAAGVLTGTPTAVGTSLFTVQVADAAKESFTERFSLVVAAATAPLSIAPATLAGGIVGTAYSATLTASGGTAPYVFAVTSGPVPAGLTFSATGVLAGQPTTAATYTFTISVVDAKGTTASQSYSVLIGAAVAPTPLSITTSTLPTATVGTQYGTSLAASGGTAPYSFTTSGNVPPGLSLSSAGVFSGTPTSTGSYTFTATVTDAKQATASQTFSVTTVAAASALSLPPATLPVGTVNAAYSVTIAATGGTSPYSYTVTSGSTPTGVTLSPGGVLAGTPTVANTYSFTVTATDSTGATASQIFSVQINAAASTTLLLTTTAAPSAILNTTYSYTLSVSNGTAPYTYALQAGSSVPAGLSLSTAGVLSGTPTSAGNDTFNVTFTDSSMPQNSGSGTVTLSVVSASATVTVDMTKTLATVPANFFGLHTSVYDTNLDDSTALPALLANTGITTLRYPGGGYSDNYHWAQASMTPFYTTTSGACGVVSDGYSVVSAAFGSFAKLLQASGTSGLVTIDYGNSVADSSASVTYGKDGNKTCSQPNTAGQPQEAAAWVAYANGDPNSTQVIGPDAVGFDWKTVGFWASLRAASALSPDDGYNFLRIGHPASLGVKFWEIGNELYYNGWATNHNSESDNHAPYIYPNGYSGGTFNSRASLPALSPTAYGTNALTFITAMKAVDSTIKIGVDFSSPISTDPIPTTWNPDLAQAVCATTGPTIDFAIMHYYPGTYLAVQPGELLSRPQTDIPDVASGIRANLTQYCTNAAAMQIWLTETSPNGTLATGFPEPVVGLFTLNDFLTALTAGIQNIDWLELHDGTFLTESEIPGPSYYGILLAHQLAAVGDAAVQATSSTTTIVPYASLKANGQKGVVLINANSSSAITVQVTVSGATLGAAAMQYSFGVNTTQSGPVLNGTSFAIPGNTFPVTVPPYTAVELIIP